jgi:tetratricopeptide (TPR) repeat protein
MLPETDSANTQYLAGLEQCRAGNLERAIDHFSKAIQLDPNHARAHSRLGGALLESGRIEQGSHHRSHAFELAPHDDEIAITHAAFLELRHQSPAVDEIVDRLLRSGNESPKLAKVYASIAPRNNRQTQALNFIDQILVNGKSRSPRQDASLHLAAAGLLDNLARYDEAFQRASTGGRLRAAQYNPMQAERPVRESVQYFTRPALRRLPHATHGSEVPVFVVGMPRSGTTLVEQILASHPAVHGAGELHWLDSLRDSIVARVPSRPPRLSDCFDRLSINDVDELAGEYLQPLQALNPSAARIINKMPANFMHLGMIQLLFPQSKVIYCRRDPLDTCVSCFLTDFMSGNEFSFGLPSLGHYYRQHEIMMSHWKSVLSLQLLDVQYERVVDDFEGQARRMLEFIDLPWDERCLRFFENNRYVATASTAQVRRPIYRNSVGRWRNYARHLTPLRNALANDPVKTLSVPRTIDRVGVGVRAYC